MPKPLRRPFGWIITVGSLVLLLMITAISGTAQTAKLGATNPPPSRWRLKSPQVRADGTVAFRLLDPNAHEVLLDLSGAAKPIAMKKDQDGVWSVTTGPLEPEFYSYSFIADGVPLMDPSNHLVRPDLISPRSIVHVPGPTSLPWESRDVPHGVVSHHFYHSDVAGDNRDFYVYTPPGYNPRGQKLYPVLYLLHGFPAGANEWTAVGRANVILDNLIAQGRAKRMIVVMPLAYGAPPVLIPGWPGFRLAMSNLPKFSETLLTEVMPRVEKDYRVLRGPTNTAIAGLSMGGGESLYVGLNHLNRFAWIGAFSAGPPPDLDHDFPQLNKKSNSEIRLLWVACGEQDPLVGQFNRNLRGWLRARGVRFTEIETPGMHTWMVWRDNLATFLPLLFRARMSAHR